MNFFKGFAKRLSLYLEIAIVIFAFAWITSYIPPVRAYVSEIVGMSIAESDGAWNPWKDSAVGDNQTTGIAASGMYIYNANTGVMSRLRGDEIYGMLVNVTSLADHNVYVINATAIPVDASGTNQNVFILNTTMIPVDASGTNQGVFILNGTAIPVDASGTVQNVYIINGNTIAVDASGTVISTIQNTVGNNFYSIKDTSITSTENFAFGFISQIVAIETPSSNTDEVCIDWAGGTAVCPAVDTAGDDRLQPGTTILIDFMSITSVSVIANSGTQTVYIRAWN